MRKSFLMLGMPALAALAFVAAPVAAASRDDVGRQMEQQYGVVGDDTREGQRLNDQLDQVVERIVGAINSGNQDREFHLKSAKILGGRDKKTDQVVNAFALPDGRIYVTLGLLRTIENSPRMDDELAFVVGHEVTHVVERHSAQQQKEATKAGILAILLGAATHSQAIGTLGGYGAAAYTAGFSRKDEYAADKGGLKAMTRAGYDPQSAVTMLERLKSKGEGSNKLVNGWFGSHPITENRIARVQGMIGDVQNGRGPRNTSPKDLEREDRR